MESNAGEGKTFVLPLLAMRFFNTMTRRLEDFTPLEPGHVRMYTCGPTVYDYAHIGNLRSFLFEDVLRRVLTYCGFRVTQVMNLTDIDDKIIRRAREQGRGLREFTAPYVEAFFEDMKTLGAEPAEVYPRATDHIPEMVALIARLLEKGVAYRAEGGVFYRIADFTNYGKLSHFDMSQMKRGERVASDEYEKEDVRDFSLWKTEDDPAFSWEASFGRGRPGWHIECSAMSMKYLGESFDIHTGGVDNIFPHHENEIAQSEAATGKPFARFWLHAEHLVVEGRKMAKSLGNFYTLRDLLGKGFQPEAVRYLLVSAHYRHPLNFTLEGLRQAESAVARYRDFLHRLRRTPYPEGSSPQVSTLIAEGRKKFEAALRDDLNTAEALGVTFTLMSEINKIEAAGAFSKGDAAKALEAFVGFDKIWALDEASDALSDAAVEALIAERDAARKAKDFRRSDAVRDELQARGIVLEDTPYGTRWKRG
jgi:cysteinyl-tRNA synthetase